MKIVLEMKFVLDRANRTGIFFLLRGRRMDEKEECPK